jgi:hypothetical protein
MEYQRTCADFISERCVGDVLFDGVMEFTGLYANLDQAMQYFNQNKSCEFIRGVFSGCKDCNGKMTVNKMILPIFKMLFPSDPPVGNDDEDGAALAAHPQTQLILCQQQPLRVPSSFCQT